MSLLVAYVQPAVGDLTEIDVPAATFRMMAQALAGTGQDGVIQPAGPVAAHRAAGANFSVDVQPFAAVVAGDDFADQGAYLIVNTAVLNVTTPSPPGSGTRTHRLVGQVRDHRANASWPAGTYDWTPLVVQDTGSGLPALPGSAIDLYAISIAAGQSNVQDSNLTSRFPVLRSLLPLGPWSSFQSGAGSWNATNNWTDFSAGNWAPLTFTVPPSGKVYVTITASPNSSIGAGGNAFIGYRISGTDTRAADSSVAIGGVAGLHQGSCRRLFTALTPGGTDTITPAWFLSPAAAGTGSDGGNGQIIVEAVQ